jgi:hypothetical protein
MGQVILGMTMSLDGFINDREGSVECLYSDLIACERQIWERNPYEILRPSSWDAIRTP